MAATVLGQDRIDMLEWRLRQKLGEKAITFA
jgi:hypothetical protein